MSLDPEYFDRDSRQPIDLNALRNELRQDQVPEVWLAIGQSNMAGQPGVSIVVHGGKDGPFPDFEIVDQAGKIIPAYHPHHRPNTESGSNSFFTADIDHGGSMASEFCRLRTAHGGAKRVVMCGGAVGGTSMVGATTGAFRGLWYGPNTTGQINAAGGELFQDALARMTTLINENDVWFRGILFHQGENDASALALGISQVTKATYKEGFVNMVNGFKGLPADYYGGHDDLIVLIGQLAEEHRDAGITISGTSVAASANVGQIDEAHRELAAENRGYELVSSDGIPLTAEGSTLLHFGSAAIWEMGRRMFSASLTAQANLAFEEPPTNTIEAFSAAQNYNEGSVVSQEDRLWRALDAVAAGSFTPSQWTNMTPALNYRGVFPLTTAFPSGDVSKGDFYEVGAVLGTVLDGVFWNTGDLLIALVDRPSTTVLSGNWARIPNARLTLANYRLTEAGSVPDTEVITEIISGIAGISEFNGLSLQAVNPIIGDLAPNAAVNNLYGKMFNVTGLDYFGFLGVPTFSTQGSGFLGFRGQEQVTGTQPATSDSIQLALNFRPREVQSFTGDGSTQLFSVNSIFVPVLAFMPNGGLGMRVFVNGVEQRQGTDYTLTGSSAPYTLTFATPPAASAAIDVIYGWTSIRGEGADGYTNGSSAFRSSPTQAVLTSSLGGIAYGINAGVTSKLASLKLDNTTVRGRDQLILETNRGGANPGIVRMTADRIGTFTVGLSGTTNTPADRFQVNNGGIEVLGNGTSIILSSPNGTRYELSAANDGTLQYGPV